MTTTDVRAALEGALDDLPRGLRDHVQRVVTEARRLASRYGIDEERAAVAALGHDLARAQPPAELLREAGAAGLELSDVERGSPILIHGALSARVMAERFGVEDADVLAAVRYHTIGRAGMSALERLIFVADKIEPEKVRGEPALAEARRLADESLEAAMRRLLDIHVGRALAQGWPLHPDTVAARNELLQTGQRARNA
ncbi:MAG: bis(5'-nucleosyl)-tetraphosphatase (symmetrical) YqeK [Chloroflexi bacterium]|nr:bis(5'-nucleosyl)-tetraphosphatase (symmetrical) YqeK [Chloroflexota bacterium]